MHFRNYHDVEGRLGSTAPSHPADLLGRWHPSNDRTSVAPPPAPLTALQQPALGKLPQTIPLVGEPVASPLLASSQQQRQGYAKRVSFTTEERIDVATLAHSDGESEPEDDASLQVAEILRQMSKAKPESFLGNKRKATTEASSDLIQPQPPQKLQQQQHQHKHVRWESQTLPATPALSVSRSKATEKAVSSATIPTTTARSTFEVSQNQLLSPPDLRRNVGLQEYDVVFDRAPLSHEAVGNRRFLVLATAQLNNIANAKGEEDIQQVITTLIDTVKKAGGRFLTTDECKRTPIEYTEAQARTKIRGFLVRLQGLHKRVGNNFPLMFYQNFDKIWHSTRKDGIVSDPERAGRQSTIRVEPMTPLMADFKPGCHDVICSRGRSAKRHQGNLNFLRLVEDNVERYTKTTCKLAKSIIVSELLDTVRRNSPFGGFVRQGEGGIWYETGDHVAREKIGQCFRDRLHFMYSSSSKAKLIKRRNLSNEQKKKTPEKPIGDATGSP